MDFICYDCSKPLFGRSDKKFCGETCRVSFNNKKYANQTGNTKKTLRILRTNTKILKTMYDEGKFILDRMELKFLDFNFHYLTFFYHSDEHGEIRFCFDYGYYINSDNKIVLVKSENYNLDI